MNKVMNKAVNHSPDTQQMTRSVVGAVEADGVGVNGVGVSSEVEINMTKRGSRRSAVSRRMLLKGAGSVLVGLPLLEEATPNVHAADAIPKRMLTMSFGLGIEESLQSELWGGPLAPFEALADKMMIFSNMRDADLAGSGTTHFKVGASQFTGKKQPNDKKAGGPSLEQIMRQALHPSGVPSVTGLPSKSAGMWSRTGSITQYCRHWNNDGSPGELPERRPSKVFDAIFGRYDTATNTGGDLSLDARIQRSVLDSVLEQYQSLTGANSYLGFDSKQKIINHLEQIRAIEKELASADGAAEQIESGEQAAGLPKKSDYADPSGIGFYDTQSGPTTGPKVDWQKAQQAFRLSGDLFALGFQMDALRFGSMLFVGAGEHLRFTGNYTAQKINQSLNFSNAFDSRSPHDGIFHNYVKDSIRVYQYYVVSQLAYVLEKMDSLQEANGKTVLDNSCVVMGTEYGKNHEDSGNIFHAVAGGNGLFRTGRITQNHNFNDVYKTVLDAYDINHNIGGDTVRALLS